jgi:cystathionine gamma-synthase
MIELTEGGEMRFETKAIHAGAGVDPATGAVAAPLHLSTTYARDASGELIGPWGYIREGNPTEALLESALATLEGGDAAVVFASGMAAGTALIQSLPSGWRLLLPDDGYYGYRILARDFLPRWGCDVELIAMDDLAALETAISSERTLVWTESPSNPLMKIVDLGEIARITHRAGGLMLVDNTFATPALQQPLALGADLALHSTTKYIGGHSDVQGGAVIFRTKGELHDAVRHTRHVAGAVASPFNSWLALRGLRSLSARMRGHCENAAAIAQFLAAHPKVHSVHYPGLSAHPRHDVAARQMTAFGGMLSFQVSGGEAEARRIAGATRLFVQATSLGGVESLIEHRATSEGAGGSSPRDLVRISAGLEHSDDLIEDLEAALA